jgi:hypothetical protein
MAGKRMIETEHAPYAMAYLRYLAGERTKVPRGPSQWGTSEADAAVVRDRVLELLTKATTRALSDRASVGKIVGSKS